MTQQAYTKPVPVPQPESDFYWEKTKEHELWLRSCNDCSQAYFYPRDICPNCFSRNTTWVQSSGKGTLHTFAIVHRAPTPAFRDDAPFVVAMVDLEEGARMPTSTWWTSRRTRRRFRWAWRLRWSSRTSRRPLPYPSSDRLDRGDTDTLSPYPTLPLAPV